MTKKWRLNIFVQPFLYHKTFYVRAYVLNHNIYLHIVITGHDLYDLKQLLEQTKNKGINVYTHGEMLPAHAYPELRKYPHLKGNFGTAWQNQQKEFANLPAPILFTTNCLMPPKASYKDRVFTTEVVSYPEVVGTVKIPAQI